MSPMSETFLWDSLALSYWLAWILNLLFKNLRRSSFFFLTCSSSTLWGIQSQIDSYESELKEVGKRWVISLACCNLQVCFCLNEVQFAANEDGIFFYTLYSLSKSDNPGKCRQNTGTFLILWFKIHTWFFLMVVPSICSWGYFNSWDSKMSAQ